MKKSIFGLILIALSSSACAPIRPDFELIETAQNSTQISTAQSRFDRKTSCHVQALRERYKHGHAHAITYICNNAASAKRIESEWAIPAEIVLAVAILESDKGGSSIAVCARNHFGIKKGDGWSGAVFTCQNGKKWRAYNSVEESYSDFGRFVNDRLPQFAAAPSVAALAKSGYAGKGRKARLYAAFIKSIITRYELAELFK